jgi:FixJ family two-component response regulator
VARKPINRKKVANLLEQVAERVEIPADEQMDEESVKKMMRLSRSELEALNAISSGRPPRNAQAILAGIRLKLEYTVKPPETKSAGVGTVHVTVNTLGEKPAAQIIPDLSEPQDEETIQ